MSETQWPKEVTCCRCEKSTSRYHVLYDHEAQQAPYLYCLACWRDEGDIRQLAGQLAVSMVGTVEKGRAFPVQAVADYARALAAAVLARKDKP